MNDNVAGSVINAGYVAPGENSALQVNCGLYSLSNRCNVPYVELIGSAGFRKTITWGELAYVPVSQAVTIANASYHGGDIVLNQGNDICNRPARITVPVPFFITETEVDIGNPLNLWASGFPCDTRGARRAYLMIDARARQFANDEPAGVFVRGKRKDNGSHNAVSPITEFEPPFGPGVGYINAHQFLAGEALSYIPLGEGASLGNDSRPHALLDAADAFLSLTRFDEVYDLSSILTWPADGQTFDFYDIPYGSTDAPGTWYLIEY